MSQLPVVLEWKFKAAQGINCSKPRGGEWSISAWPESLGPKPTSDQIAQWTIEYEAAMKLKAEEDSRKARREKARAEALDAILDGDDSKLAAIRESIR